MDISAPEGDDFYVPPSSLAGEHGDVIWSRPLEGVAALKAAARNELVLYCSRSVQDRPIAVSGIVALPEKGPPPGGYPVISWAHGTVGLGGGCAPSRDSEEMRDRLLVHHLINQAPHVMLDAFLERGWAVAMTDYEGMGTPGPHPYLVGDSEGRGVLDIVRAARQLFPAVSGPLAIVGHSQGGQAALFAAHLAESWTPELDLRGVGAMAPASHVRDVVLLGSQIAVPLPGYAFTALFLTGAMAAAPGAINAERVLSDEASERFLAGSDLCRVELSEEASMGGLLGTEQFRGDILRTPNADQQRFLAELDRMNPALPIPVPIRIAQAAEDPRTPIADTTRLVAELVALCNDVTYRVHLEVEDPPEIGPHFGTIDTDTAEMTDWLAERLA
jgi:Secretory lipase